MLGARIVIISKTPQIIGNTADHHILIYLGTYLIKYNIFQTPVLNSSFHCTYLSYHGIVSTKFWKLLLYS